MSEFIKVIEGVLSPELCKRLMHKFDKAKTQPGRTGGGVDADKKVSTDVSIIRNPEIQPETQKYCSIPPST